jgi:Glycosyl transferase family 2
MNPQASVLIPVYNGERYLEDAITSALSQTFADFEVVVCDNSSTDQTRKIASAFVSDHRVRVIEFETHVSAPLSFDRALDEAKGAYVRYLCHDDMLDPRCLEMSIEALQSSPSAVFATSYETTFGSTVFARQADELGPSGLRHSSDVARSIIRKGNWIGGPTAVTAKRLALQRTRFDSRLACSFDVGAWLGLLAQGDLCVIPEVLFHSRIHESQESRRCAQGGFRAEWSFLLSNLDRSRLDVTKKDILVSRAKNFLGRM